MIKTNITESQVNEYNTNGFIKIPQILSSEEVSHFHDVVMKHMKDNEGKHHNTAEVFTQMVNIWRINNDIKKLTLHKNIASCAEKLAGTELKIWHDHAIVKKPNNLMPTEYHQDNPYWPHKNKFRSLSCWIALCDVPEEKGCMSFLKGSHKHTSLAPQDLNDKESLFTICPEMKEYEETIVPLKAGDCTFHNGYTAHMAYQNSTNDFRMAHIIIFMEKDTVFTGYPHVITDDLAIKEGDKFEGELFPIVN